MVSSLGGLRIFVNSTVMVLPAYIMFPVIFKAMLWLEVMRKDIAGCPLILTEVKLLRLIVEGNVTTN